MHKGIAGLIIEAVNWQPLRKRLLLNNQVLGLLSVKHKDIAGVV